MKVKIGCASSLQEYKGLEFSLKANSQYVWDPLLFGCILLCRPLCKLSPFFFIVSLRAASTKTYFADKETKIQKDEAVHPESHNWHHFFPMRPSGGRLLPGYDIAFLRVALVLGTQGGWQHYIQGRRKRRSKEERRRPKKSSQAMLWDTLPTSPQPEYSLMIISRVVGKMLTEHLTWSSRGTEESLVKGSCSKVRCI